MSGTLPVPTVLLMVASSFAPLSSRVVLLSDLWLVLIRHGECAEW